MRGLVSASASTVFRSSRVSGPTTSAAPDSAAAAKAGSTPSSPCAMIRVRDALPAALAAARNPALTAAAAGPYSGDSSGRTRQIVSQVGGVTIVGDGAGATSCGSGTSGGG